MGVTSRDSTQRQVMLAKSILASHPACKRLLLFVNVSALHQPNCIFQPGATSDTPETQAAALAYVDRQLPPLFRAFQQRGPTLAIICSDHGTAYGERGYVGHRVGDPVVWTVPYAECILPEAVS